MKKAERLHYAKLSALGCIVCLRAGHGYSIPEIHHTRQSVGMGQKSHYLQAIGLCHAHHRTGGYGIAYHSGRQEFEANNGTESELLEATTEALK